MKVTLFRQLVQERGWTTVQTFGAHFTTAARELAAETGERRLADVTVSRRTFDRWMSGDMKGMPQKDTRRILEHVFQQPIAWLFAPPPEADTGPASDAQEEISRWPLWPEPDRGGFRAEQLLLAKEGAAVGRRRFLLAGGAAALPHRPGGGEPASIHDRHHTGAQVDAVLIHLREMWHMLVQSDNLLGPRHALHGVHQNLAVLQELLDSTVAPMRDEVLRLAACYAESAAWLHEDCAADQDDVARALHWTQQAMEWSVEVGDDTLTAWTLFRRAQQATAAGKAAQSISLSRAVQRYDRVLTPQMRAAALQQEAHGYALLGDEITCHRLIDQAHSFAASPESAGDGRSGHGDFATPAYLEGQRANCWLLLSRPDRAVPLLAASLSELPEIYRRDRGLIHARLAASYARTGEIEHAVEQAHLALAVARGAGSARTLRETITAVDAMGPANGNARVAELAEAVVHSG
ncbi:hypothetical protein ABZ896_11385 [Streptomyces sp. NPDC047072]|uniref:hypothetical protein n=1 Tax=Streptomyces sp. NPDC047072 TaxID=3154809 RepID=UPI0033FBC97E